MDQHQDEELIPDTRVARRYGVHSITLSRWTADPKLAFPRPIIINKRRYRRKSELELFERAHVARKYG
jgi:hypothetical protein